MIFGAVLGCAALTSQAAFAQHGAQDGQWTSYAGDKGSTKYSTLDQIDRDNVKDLQVAWRWSSPDNAVEKGASYGNKVSPLFVDGVLYMGSMYGIASAIDAKTGETLWTFDPKVWDGRRPGNLGFNARSVVLVRWQGRRPHYPCNPAQLHVFARRGYG